MQCRRDRAANRVGIEAAAGEITVQATPGDRALEPRKGHGFLPREMLGGRGRVHLLVLDHLPDRRLRNRPRYPLPSKELNDASG